MVRKQLGEGATLELLGQHRGGLNGGGSKGANLLRMGEKTLTMGKQNRRSGMHNGGSSQPKGGIILRKTAGGEAKFLSESKKGGATIWCEACSRLRTKRREAYSLESEVKANTEFGVG